MAVLMVLRPYREGRVHVQAEKCATCIFRPGGFRGLRPGRRAEIVQNARASGTAIVCHETYDGEAAVCRGFFDLPQQPQVLQLAERLDVITYDEPRKRALRG